MIRTYEWNGGLWRFEQDQAPEGAVEHKAKPKPEPKKKTRRVANKARTARNKEANNHE